MTRRYTLATGDEETEVLVVIDPDPAKPPHVALRPGVKTLGPRVWGPPLAVVREDHQQ